MWVENAEGETSTTGSAVVVPAVPVRLASRMRASERVQEHIV